ncbi:Glycosyltransferase family 31 protein [Mycena indigotica]|uniref:Glycosyltransferase family 31 protein n=1 Tax=Mycena indigotica TaxID=2126181 RepID=A0A8H6SWW5_9AGAR|nr:Glycosyltransferase family 31 protein [Mycena indigotica]KAF7306906.1 Glycosyltransferase family 31 protein [Mycena indigotica]
MTSLPKAVLYYSESNCWSDATMIALAEKGYTSDELDKKIVDISKGENLILPYLRINIKGTVPTLVVPFQDSLSGDVESRYKALSDPKAIIDFLDEARGSVSRTRTTSTAPAPALRPATVAYSAVTTALREILHSEEVSPDRLALLNARDEESLKTLAITKEPILKGIQQTLVQCLADADAGTIQASEKVKSFWRQKLSDTEELLQVLQAADKETESLNETARKEREEFLQKAKTIWQVTVKETCVKVNQDIIGPYVLGDQFSVADISLGSWLRMMVQLAGATATDDDGVQKLEAYIGGGLSLDKLTVFWAQVKERASWKTL